MNRNSNSRHSSAQWLLLGGLGCTVMCVCVALAGIALPMFMRSSGAPVAQPLPEATRASLATAAKPTAPQTATNPRAVVPASANPVALATAAPKSVAGKRGALSKKIRAELVNTPCKFIAQAGAMAALGEAVKDAPKTQSEDDDFALCGYDALAPTSDVFRGAYVFVFEGDAARAEFLQSIKDLQGGLCGAGVSFGKTQTPDGLANLAGKSLVELAAMEQQLFRDQCSASDYGFQVVPGIGDASEFKAWSAGATLDVVVDDVLLRFATLRVKSNPDRAAALAGLTALAQPAMDKLQ
ncbi:MAG: hypothetical protein KGJ80_05625 [Chloroflexota bacterium]|nr:hypothetical protein [Chloroflexota bacterium]